VPPLPCHRGAAALGRSSVLLAAGDRNTEIAEPISVARAEVLGATPPRVVLS